MRRAAAALLSALLACGHAAPPPPVDRPLEIGDAVDWAPAAGLQSIVIVQPKAVMAHAELLPPIADVLPNESFDVFKSRHGGVDPRELDELVVASYGADKSIVLARGVVDPAKLEAAFSDRVTTSKRFVDQPGGPLSTVLRFEGDANDPRPTEREMVVFGRQAVGYETEVFPTEDATRPRTHVGPLRAAELFAFGKLKKASPVLRTSPLDVAAKLAGGGPVRVFCPGPFSGGTEQGLAGLLKGATAVGITVRPEAPRPDGKPALHVTLVLTGAWSDGAPAAAERLGAALTTMASSSLGRLCGVNQPLRGPDVRGQPDALFAEAVIDATLLGKGLHAAVASEVSEMMKL